jgi:phage/plasmid-associated DNA primase
MLEDRFALSDLEGKFVNIDTELTSTTIRDTSVLKKLTGWQPTRIQRKNQKAYDARISAKLYFSANKIPVAYDESDAFFRRKVILSFPNSSLCVNDNLQKIRPVSIVVTLGREFKSNLSHTTEPRPTST